MSNQDIFEGQASKWTWAAIDCDGAAWLCEGRPGFISGQLQIADKHRAKRAPDYDKKLTLDHKDRVTHHPAIAWAREPDVLAAEDDGDDAHDGDDPLEDAKIRATQLWQGDALTLVQYMAIFGEVPK